MTLLKNNTDWISTKLSENPDYFNALSKGQSPAYLYIGCSDSRVSPNIMSNTDLGDMFVHRNIANQVKEEDDSVQSVLEYGIEALKVNHIIVCGHSCCGGIQAAITDTAPEVVHRWISPIRQLYIKNKSLIDSYESLEQQVFQLAKLNVKAQVESIKLNKSYIKSTETKSPPQLHAWIFDLKSGRIITLEL